MASKNSYAPVQALDDQPGKPETPRATKGTGTTVQADLKDHPQLLEAIRISAKADDREVSNWLKRRLVKLHEDGKLIPAE
jgi:hypothetical protein